MKRFKIMHKYTYMLKPQSLVRKQLTTPYNDFLPSFTKHCTNSKSTCSKFSILLCYMPIDSSIGYAKPLSCQPRAQLLGFWDTAALSCFACTGSIALVAISLARYIMIFTRKPCTLAFQKLMRSCCRMRAARALFRSFFSVTTATIPPKSNGKLQLEAAKAVKRAN